MILAIMVTEQCNFMCGHCMLESSGTYSLVSDQVISKYLEMLEYGRPDEVYIMGGEPTLHMDKVEYIVNETKKYCKDITMFSNGSFLLNSQKKERVKGWGIKVRISDDEYHRKKWTDRLEKEIYSSGYTVVKREPGEDMIPVGRAYEAYKHLNYDMGCSLLNGIYEPEYPNRHRYMIMLNGDVNLYCATVEGALANVFEDKNIDYDFLVKREKILHNYLMENVIHKKEDKYMAVMCNRCSKYKVTENAIYYCKEKVADTADYQ